MALPSSGASPRPDRIRLDIETPRRPGFARSRQDYSPEGLFSAEHADFLAKADRYQPSIRGSFGYLPNGTLGGDTGSYDQSRFEADGTVPLVVDPDTVVLVGAHGEARDYRFSSDFGPGANTIEDTTVGAVGLHLGFGRFFTDDTYVHAVFSPGIYSDFGGTLTHQDWKFFGEAVMTFRYHESLYLKGGVEVSEDFRDAPVFPLLGLSWLMAPGWRADVLLPRHAELSYEFDAATMMYGGLDLEGQEYRLRSSAGTGSNEIDMQVQELQLYLGLLHRFDDNLSVFGRFGAVVAGDHKFTAPNNSRIEGQMDPTLLFEAGIGWDF